MLTKIPLSACTWEGIVDAIHRHFSHWDKAVEAAAKKLVSQFFRLLASDFLDPLRSDQYNTIKHAFRGQLGGVRVHVGEPLEDGSPPPSEAFLDLGGSEFGSIFFTLESLGQKYQYRLQRVVRNWHPEILAHRLRLITISLKNIITFLHLENGFNADNLTFGWPDEAAFADALGSPLGVVSLKFPGLNLDPCDIAPASKEQILAVYPPTTGAPPSKSPS